MVAASCHDRFADADYARLAGQGMRFAREGVRWHLVETAPGRYDFASVRPIADAARRHGIQVIWDLCHFGWPDHLDLFGRDFPEALARFGAAFALWLESEGNGPGWLVPVNEISFFSWAAGDEGSLYPFARGRGFELKCQLVRAAIQTMDAIRAACPTARFIHVDPVIHVAAHPNHPEEHAAAEAYRVAQFQALDMLAGRAVPECGGAERYLDVIGLNYYPQNQWFYNLRGTRPIRKWRAIPKRSPLYRPFRDMLAEVHQRFQKPLLVAETGAESRRRRPWFRYVCEETLAAIQNGVPVSAICLYPILNHPGWMDDRHCENGLWDYADAQGHRQIYRPLALELKRWSGAFEAGRNPALLGRAGTAALDVAA